MDFDFSQVLGRMVDEWKKMTKSDAVPILAVTIVHKTFAQQHPEATVKFVRAMIAATDSRGPLSHRLDAGRVRLMSAAPR